MALGKISGHMLTSNLLRNNEDLSFETNLLYLSVSDPVNQKIGIGTESPVYLLDVNGTTRSTNIRSTNVDISNINITNNTISSIGNLTISAISNNIVLSSNLTSTNKILIGSSAVTSRFPNAQIIISDTAVGIQQNESHNIGLLAEATAGLTGVYGVGLYGVAYTSSTTQSRGVVGEAHVAASSNTQSAIGVLGYSQDTHAGGFNIGLYGRAENGASNYALYIAAGNIKTQADTTWDLGGNLTFSGSSSITIPNLTVSNSLILSGSGTSTSFGSTSSTTIFSGTIQFPNVGTSGVVTLGPDGTLIADTTSYVSSALTINTTGTDISSSISSGVITLSIPTASATNRGALSSTDWTTFNNKLSSYTETSTLSNVTSRGASTANASSFTGGLTVGTSLSIPSGDTLSRPTAVAGNLRFNTTLEKFEGYAGAVKGWGEIGGGGSGLTPTSIKTSAYTAVANDLVRCDTRVSAFSITLPATPADGDIIAILDVYNQFGTYNLTVLPNGKTIEGDSTSLILDVNGAYVSFVYNLDTLNWKIQSTPLRTTSNAAKGFQPTSIKTSAYTAVSNELVRCNTTSGSFIVTLPAAPIDGDMIAILDVYNQFGTYNLTVLPNGNTIANDTSLIFDVNGAYESFIYNSDTFNWSVLNTSLPAFVTSWPGLTPTGIKTSAYTAVANDLVRCNTSGGPFSVTLPLSPSDGILIGFIDVYNTFGTKNLTILPNGKTIEGDSTSLILDVNGNYAELLYNAETSNWKIQNTPSAGLSGTGSLLPTPVKTTAYTAIAGELVRCNSSTGSFSITLPATPADGTIIGVVDIGRTFGSQSVTILPNGQTIEGDSTSLILDVNGTYETFVYNLSLLDWKIQSTPIPNSPVASTVSTILDDISMYFDGVTSVFKLKANGVSLNTLVDSKDVDVFVNGIKISPCADIISYPWLTPYNAGPGFRIKNLPSNTDPLINVGTLIIYKSPSIGSSVSLTTRYISSSRQTQQYPFNAMTIALGD